MSWSRKLAAPIALKDGRKLLTLADARAVIETLPARRQQLDHLLFAGQLAHEAARRGAIFDTQVQLTRALTTEGLIARLNPRDI